MPLRIAIAGAIALAACLIIPVSVSAVSSVASAQDSAGGKASDADDTEPPEPHSSRAPMSTAVNADGIMGAQIASAGYSGKRSWSALVMIITAGFLPSVLMIRRSSQRRRAGPLARAG